MTHSVNFRSLVILVVMVGMAAVTVRVAGYRREAVVSSVELGTPTSQEESCAGAGIDPAHDYKRWPANGKYDCGNGNRGNTAASPNPLVADGWTGWAGDRACPAIFGVANGGTDEGGTFARVSAQDRTLGIAGCEDASSVRFYKSYTPAVYDTSELCVRRDDDADGYTPSEGDCNDDPNNYGNQYYPGASEDCYQSGSDYNCDGTPDYMGAYCQALLGTPIIVDTAGDGIRLSNAEDGVSFDLKPDGVPEELPWTLPGTNDAWLALDRNGNGSIDSGLELFGNFTAQPFSTGPHGFLALAVFDYPENGGNGDGWISRDDPVYRNLRLWMDRNHDGVSQPGELKTLADVGLHRLSLDYAESRRVDRWGNWFRYRARVVDGRGQDLGRWAYDVYLAAKPPRGRGGHRR